MQRTIGIGLFGKGSTNHLHRPEILEIFRSKGFKVIFIVRDDYIPLLPRMDHCDYVSCKVHDETGWRALILSICQHIRHMYPSKDPGRRKIINARLRQNFRPWSLAYEVVCRFAAGYRWCVSVAAYIETLLFRLKRVEGINPALYDILLLLGVGTVNSELEGSVTLWGERCFIPVIHAVGNYDNLTSKGFRGIRPKKLLVWGPQMHDDAVNFQGISPSRISIIGSIRYNSINSFSKLERNNFLKQIGLDSDKKTLVFAGFVFISQYFEMMDIYHIMLENGNPCQLILRLYPSKALMNSVYIMPLIEYAKSLPRVFISYADPHFKYGDRSLEVLQVEEYELWHILRHCDVLVDYYSTITIEGAIFDKPVIHMHYFPSTPEAFIKKPIPIEFWNLIHNRRILSYGAVDVASSRDELIDLIKSNLARPSIHSEARINMVQRECGLIDGKACERLVEECINMLQCPK